MPAEPSAGVLSFGPPTSALAPSPDKANDVPCPAVPAAPVPTSLLPCCVHAPPERANTQAAPAFELSPGPPISAVLPSPDRAAEAPCDTAGPEAPAPTSLTPCCVQALPERVNTQAAPAVELSCGPPVRAVLPSADRATEVPWLAAPAAPTPTNFAPWTLLSAFPPMSAVLPSADKATEIPKFAAPAASLGTSFAPCCVEPPLARG